MKGIALSTEVPSATRWKQKVIISIMFLSAILAPSKPHENGNVRIYLNPNQLSSVSAFAMARKVVWSYFLSVQNAAGKPVTPKLYDDCRKWCYWSSVESRSLGIADCRSLVTTALKAWVARNFCSKTTIFLGDTKNHPKSRNTKNTTFTHFAFFLVIWVRIMKWVSS